MDEGVTWVSVHHGGGVGVTLLHAGVVIVADGTKEAESRIEPCIDHSFVWVVVRHADAGYELAN